MSVLGNIRGDGQTAWGWTLKYRVQNELFGASVFEGGLPILAFRAS